VQESSWGDTHSLCVFRCEEDGGSSLLRDKTNGLTRCQIPGRKFRVDVRSCAGSIAESSPHVKEASLATEWMMRRMDL
jgi:hypothetical protein